MGKNTNEMLHKWPRNWYKKRWWRIYFYTVFPTHDALMLNCVQTVLILMMSAVIGLCVVFERKLTPFNSLMIMLLILVLGVMFVTVEKAFNEENQKRGRTRKKVEEMKKVKVDDPYEELYLQIIEPMRGVSKKRELLMPYCAAMKEELLPKWSHALFEKKTGLVIPASYYSELTQEGAYTPEELEPYAQRFVSLKAKIANSK